MICTIITHLKHVKPFLSIVSIDISPMWEFLSILMWEFWNVITSCTPSKSYICLYGFIVFLKTVQTMGYVRNVPKNKCASLSYPKVRPLWKAPPMKSFSWWKFPTSEMPQSLFLPLPGQSYSVPPHYYPPQPSPQFVSSQAQLLDNKKLLDTKDNILLLPTPPNSQLLMFYARTHK